MEFPSINITGIFDKVFGFVSFCLNWIKETILGLSPQYGELILLALALIGAWAIVKKLVSSKLLIIIVGLFIYLAIRFSGG